MAEKVLPTQVFRVECPWKHETYKYRTAISKEDLNLKCVHCGASCKIENIKG